MSNVITRVEGHLGHITLDRPERINALDLPMVEAVLAALDRWEADPRVTVVLIDATGNRGLCAGGDIRSFYESIQAGNDDAPHTFWQREYRMNATIAHYPKPVVSLMDGIVFGGGVGISAHAGVRIVTERSQVAMPETAIGLSPDVGALYLLARSPGGLGLHAALTGARLTGLQAIQAGLADFLVPSSELASFIAPLEDGQVPELLAPAVDSPPGWMDECYSAPTAENILQALEGHSAADAQVAGQVLRSMSPTAVKVTLAAVRRAADMTLDQVLDQDLRLSMRFLHHPDFEEGIRALLIDRDRNPQWKPGSLEEVEDAAVEEFFAPLR